MGDNENRTNSAISGEQKSLVEDGRKRSLEGLIVKGIGGFYYIETQEGIIRAKGRGIFKKEGKVLTVGDKVIITVRDDGDSVIEEICPRKNVFIRPPIANVDKIIIVSAVKKPKVNFEILDRFLIMAEKNNVSPVICFNKMDLADESFKEKIDSVYGNLYRVIYVSGKTGEGLDLIKAEIRDNKVAFAGPSGVGKSTIINKISPKANLETGDISSKTNRGKHTTRHVEIFDFEGGKVFDTPGFTSFDILEVEEEELSMYYPEIFEIGRECKFDNCRHIKEPNCAVIKALEEGRLSQMRYQSYVNNLEEIRKRNRNKY